MLVVGLTGSIGAGKSTVAAMLAAAGAAVHDADQAVHDLYRGAAVPLIAAEFPAAVMDGVVDRGALGRLVADDRAALDRLEAIVHPLVQEAQSRFLDTQRQTRRLAVLDIPLLLETGGAGRVDVVVLVRASVGVRRGRVLQRKGMTEARFDALAARQMADDDKARLAHSVIDNDGSLAVTERQVADFLRAFAGRLATA